MSFFRKLFGLDAKSSGSAGRVVGQAEHGGFHIAATPYPEAGQFQVAGVISKDIDGSRREHRFVRADRFATLDEAAEFAIQKGRQIIDQQGDRLFG